MSSTAKRKPAYDPSRQWGLKPEPSRTQGDGATYVVSGHVISGSSDTKNLFVGETMGREAQAKAARQASKDSDRALQLLLKRDKEGMKAVTAARAFVKQPLKGAKKDSGKTEVPSKRKRRSEESSESSGSSGEESDAGSKPGAKSYSAELIRNLGFDPTGRKTADVSVQKKVEYDFVRMEDVVLIFCVLQSWRLWRLHIRLAETLISGPDLARNQPRCGHPTLSINLRRVLEVERGPRPSLMIVIISRKTSLSPTR